MSEEKVVVIPVEVPSEPTEEVVEDGTEDCPNPVVEAELLERALAALDNPKNKRKFLTYTRSNSLTQIVYVSNDTWYSIDYLAPTEGEGHKGLLSTWERPEGTSKEDVPASTYNDEELTGCVISGTNVIPDESDRFVKRHFHRSRTPEDRATHAALQERYRKIISDLAGLAER